MQEPKGPGWPVMTPPGGFLQGCWLGVAGLQGRMRGSSLTSVMAHTSLFRALSPPASLGHVLAYVLGLIIPILQTRKPRL